MNDKNYKSSGGFCHVVYNEGIPNSLSYDSLINFKQISEEIADSFNVKIKQLLRIKLNLTTPVPNYNVNNFCMPHVDFQLPHHVFLYYINDSDGDTVFFDKSINLQSNDLKINHRITPEKGKCVLFDGSIYHTQSNPINSSIRMNINIDAILF